MDESNPGELTSLEGLGVGSGLVLRTTFDSGYCLTPAHRLEFLTEGAYGRAMLGVGMWRGVGSMRDPMVHGLRLAWGKFFRGDALLRARAAWLRLPEFSHKDSRALLEEFFRARVREARVRALEAWASVRGVEVDAEKLLEELDLENRARELPASPDLLN